MTPFASVAFVSSEIVLATPGKVFSITCTIAAAGTYYLVALDTATVPSNSDNVSAGAKGRVLRDVPITTTAANQIVDLGFEEAGFASDSGVHVGTGCVVLLSSTAPTSITLVASGMWVNADLG